MNYLSNTEVRSMILVLNPRLLRTQASRELRGTMLCVEVNPNGLTRRPVVNPSASCGPGRTQCRQEWKVAVGRTNQTGRWGRGPG